MIKQHLSVNSFYFFCRFRNFLQRHIINRNCPCLTQLMQSHLRQFIRNSPAVFPAVHGCKRHIHMLCELGLTHVQIKPDFFNQIFHVASPKYNIIYNVKYIRYYISCQCIYQNPLHTMLSICCRLYFASFLLLSKHDKYLFVNYIGN